MRAMVLEGPCGALRCVPVVPPVRVAQPSHGGSPDLLLYHCQPCLEPTDHVLDPARRLHVWGLRLASRQIVVVLTLPLARVLAMVLPSQSVVRIGRPVLCWHGGYWCCSALWTG